MSFNKETKKYEGILNFGNGYGVKIIEHWDNLTPTYQVFLLHNNKLYWDENIVDSLNIFPNKTDITKIIKIVQDLKGD